MDDRQMTLLPDIDETIALVFRSAPFAPDINPGTKEIVQSLNFFKGIYQGRKFDEITKAEIWFIRDINGSVVWRVRAAEVLEWTPMPSLNRA